VACPLLQAFSQVANISVLYQDFLLAYQELIERWGYEGSYGGFKRIAGKLKGLKKQKRKQRKRRSRTSELNIPVRSCSWM
jgi:hypothetical protein